MTRLGLSIRQRLLVLTGVALLPTLAVIGFNELNLRKTRTAEINDLAQRNAKLANEEIGRIIEGIENLLITVSAVPSVRSFDEPACVAFLRDLTPRFPHLSSINVVDAQGILRCRSTMPQPTPSFADAQWFQETLQRNRLSIGTAVKGRVEGRFVLPVATPFRDAAGTTLGVIVAGINLDWFGNRLRERGLTRGGALTVADRDGVIIARDPLPERFVGTKIPEPFMRLVRSDKVGSEEVLSQDGTRRMLGYVPVTVPPEGIYVSVGLSSDESFAAIDRSTRITVAIAALGTLIAFVFAWLVGERVLRMPVAIISNTIEAWRSGQRDARTGFREGDELTALGEAMDRMMDELVRRQDERELLVHELHHRVKNNLAILQSVATQTLRRANVPREVAETLTRRIQALAGAHDLLARESWEGAEIHDLVHGAIAVQATETGGRIVVGGPSARIDARTAMGLTLVFHELITNAIKYGALGVDGGSVRLSWVGERGPGDVPALHFTWEETGGPAVAPPAREGFGMQVIRRSLGASGLGDPVVQFRPEGVVCAFVVPAAVGPAAMPVPPQAAA